MMQAPITREEAQEVPLGKIEATLAKLSREANSAVISAGGQVAARSSVMTLVAYACGSEQANRVSRAVEGLTGQHPSRSIILAAEPDGQGPPLTASVSLHCHVAHQGSGQMCAEQIKIEARGDATKHMAGVVLPLLLTELPVFVWWTDGLPEGELVDNLVDLSDRVLIDSADFTKPNLDLVRLADLVQQQSNRTAFSDFNWNRLKAWRELTAQFFDAPRLRPYLDGIQRVEIEYAVGADQRPNPIQAYQFAGWLASRMRWQTLTAMHTPGGASHIGLRTRLGAPVALEILPRQGIETRDWWAMSSAEWKIPTGDTADWDTTTGNGNGNGHDQARDPNVGVGALMRVNIQTRLNGKPATFTVLRDDDMKSATTVVVADGETAPQRCAPLNSNSETSLLHGQLANFGHDQIFEAALAAAKLLINQDHGRGR